MIVGLCLLTGLLALIAVLPFIVDWNRYRDHYLPILENAIGRKITVGDVRLRFFPVLRLHVEDIRIADDPAFREAPFLVVPKAEATISWKSLLQRQIKVEHMLVQSPQIAVVRSKEGVFNVGSMGTVSTSSATRASDSFGSRMVNPLLGVLAVQNLSLSGGVITLEDRKPVEPSLYTFSNLNITTDSVEWGQIATVQAEGKLSPNNVPVNFQGQFGPLHPTFDLPQIQVAGKIGGVNWSANGEFIKGILEAEVRVPQVAIGDIPGGLTIPKSGNLSDIVASLRVPILNPSRGGSLADIIIHPVRANLHLGNGLVQLEGEGTLSTLHLRGRASTLSTQDFLPKYPWTQPVVLKSVEIQSVLQDSRVDFPVFQAEVFRGRLKGEGTWEKSGTGPTFTARGRLQDFDVQQVQAVVFPSRVVMTGVGDLHWRIKGTLGGATPPQWSGPLTLSIGEGQLSGVDLLHMVEEALRMPGLFEHTPGITDFSHVQVEAKGYPLGAQITLAAIESPAFLAQATGMVGWDEKVKGQGEFSFPQKIAKAVIQRFPLARVAMTGDRLTIPFVIEGTVQTPVLRLNTQSLGTQLQQRVNQALEKALQGDKQDMQELLQEGSQLLRQFFRQ